MTALKNILHGLARTFRALPADDLWQPLARALDRYADGEEQYADFLRVQQHREEILETVYITWEKAVIAKWLAGLQEPVPKPPQR
jgi:hypothetical protein